MATLPYCSVGKYGMLASIVECASMACSGVLAASLDDVTAAGGEVPYVTDGHAVHVPSHVLHTCVSAVYNMSKLDSGLEQCTRELESEFDSFDYLLDVLSSLNPEGTAGDSNIKLTSGLLLKFLSALSNFTCNLPAVSTAMCKPAVVRVRLPLRG